jgi:hypothetical protein
MHTENTYLAEIAYRRNRIREGAASRRQTRTRVPFSRRPSEASDTSR